VPSKYGFSLFLYLSTEWVQGKFGLGDEASLTLQWGVIWLLVAAALSNQAAIMSGDTPQLLRRALVINACLHGLGLAVVSIAVLPSALLTVGPVVALYALVHGVWLKFAWPRLGTEEGLAAGS